MIINSIKGYFYRLYNICYVLVLTPLALFLFLYYQTQVGKILPVIQDQYEFLIVELSFFMLVLTSLTTVHLYLRKRFVIVSKYASLGDKMNRYFPLALMRTGVGSVSAFIVSTGFYFTESVWLAGAFGVTMFWIWWQWPTPKRFCNDLSVRTDERELMLRSKDSF